MSNFPLLIPSGSEGGATNQKNNDNNDNNDNDQSGHVVLIQEPDLVYLLSRGILALKPESVSKAPAWLVDQAAGCRGVGEEYDDDEGENDDKRTVCGAGEKNRAFLSTAAVGPSQMMVPVDGIASNVTSSSITCSTHCSVGDDDERTPRRQLLLHQYGKTHESRDSGYFTYIATIRPSADGMGGGGGQHGNDYPDDDAWALVTASPSSLSWWSSPRSTGATTISTSPDSDDSLWLEGGDHP